MANVEASQTPQNGSDGPVLPAVVSDTGDMSSRRQVPVGSGDSDFDEIALARFTDEDWDRLRSLTPLQQRFVLEYPIDFNGTAAAGRAGYQGGDNALAVRSSVLLRHPRVGTLVRKLASATADEMGLTREWLMKELENTAAQAQQLENPHARAKTLDLIARLRGDMIQRSQVEVRSVNITINDVEMEDLR